MRVVRAPTLAMTLATSIIIHRGTDRTTAAADGRSPAAFGFRPRAPPAFSERTRPVALKSTRAYPLSAIAIQFALECRFLTYY